MAWPTLLIFVLSVIVALKRKGDGHEEGNTLSTSHIVESGNILPPPPIPRSWYMYVCPLEEITRIIYLFIYFCVHMHFAHDAVATKSIQYELKGEEQLEEGGMNQ